MRTEEEVIALHGQLERLLIIDGDKHGVHTDVTQVGHVLLPGTNASEVSHPSPAIVKVRQDVGKWLRRISRSSKADLSVNTRDDHVGGVQVVAEVVGVHAIVVRKGGTVVYAVKGSINGLGNTITIRDREDGLCSVLK